MDRAEIESRIKSRFGQGCFSVHEAEKRSGVSAFTIKRWIREGMDLGQVKYFLSNDQENDDSFVYVFDKDSVVKIKEISQLSPRGRREKGLV